MKYEIYRWFLSIIRGFFHIKKYKQPRRNNWVQYEIYLLKKEIFSIIINNRKIKITKSLPF
jgi:hypothetical protein